MGCIVLIFPRMSNSSGLDSIVLTPFWLGLTLVFTYHWFLSSQKRFWYLYNIYLWIINFFSILTFPTNNITLHFHCSYYVHCLQSCYCLDDVDLYSPVVIHFGFVFYSYTFLSPSQNLQLWYLSVFFFRKSILSITIVSV